MRKIGLILATIVILVTMLSLIACAPLDQGEKEIYSENQEYKIDYKDGMADCTMNLDGKGNCSITRKIDYTKQIDEENLVSCTYVGSSRYIHLEYSDSFINVSSNYSFTSDGQLVPYSSVATTSSYLTYAQAVDNVYTISITTKIDDTDVNITLRVKPKDGSSYKVALGYTATLPEYSYASGEYKIVDGKFIKLKVIYPTTTTTRSGLQNYQNIPVGENYYTSLVTEDDGRENGLVRVIGSNFVAFAQLRDDGTFDFVRAVTSVADEVCFTQETYYGKSFVTSIETVYGNEIYSYKFQLSFDETTGRGKLELLEATMLKNYVANEEGSLDLLAYDIEAYKSLIGTHRQLGTSNNISFSNDYKIYADYNYSRYVFEGNLNINMFKIDDYIYLHATNEKGSAISAKFYEDGSWEWIESEFKGIDFSDHSEDF